MSWQDRDYNRDAPERWRGGGGSFLSVLYFLLMGSFPIGRYFGISVRVHMTFVLLVIFETLLRGGGLWSLRWTSLLFVSVLLHEFGHCFGCRSVGGDADHIVMWPLGGLAFCRAPHRPWAEFVTVACGPLVTLLLAAGSYLTLLIWFGNSSPVSLNPLQMWRMGWHGGVIGVIRDIYLVNYTLLLFNLLMAFYPFDGGRLVQVALWKATDYTRSMKWSTAVGMGGAGGAVLFGILNVQLWIALLGVFGFITCYRQSQAIAAGYGAEPQYDVGLYNRGNAKQGWLARQRAKRSDAQLQRKRQRSAKAEHELDRILAKVKDHGLHSLNRKEKKVLQQATDEKRRAG